MEPRVKRQPQSESENALDMDRLSDYLPSKKTPDEEQPSISGNNPDLLDSVPQPKEEEGFIHMHNDELLEEPRKVEDGRL